MSVEQSAMDQMMTMLREMRDENKTFMEGVNGRIDTIEASLTEKVTAEVVGLREEVAKTIAENKEVSKRMLEDLSITREGYQEDDSLFMTPSAPRVRYADGVPGQDGGAPLPVPGQTDAAIQEARVAYRREQERAGARPIELRRTASESETRREEVADGKSGEAPSERMEGSANLNLEERTRLYTSTDVRGYHPLRPKPLPPKVPEQYDGSDKSPMKLKTWHQAVGMYLAAVGIASDDVDAFSQIVLHTAGKAHEVLVSYGWPVVENQLRHRTPGVLTRTSWSLDFIRTFFEKRFVSETAKIDAEYAFDRVKQLDNGKWTEAATLAEDIRYHGEQIREYTPYRGKRRLVDALHPNVAQELLRMQADWDDPMISFRSRA